MKITISPINAGFINRILFFNLTKKPFDDYDTFRDQNIDIAFVLNDAYMGVDLENNLYYCYLDKTKAWYGPYDSYQEVISNILFGKYDGLFTLMSGVVFDKNIGMFKFTFADFEYNMTTYNFNVPLRKIAQEISETVRPIQQKEIIINYPETTYNEGVINEFLISLNNVFSEDSFPDKAILTDLCSLISVGRVGMFSDKTPNKFYLIMNLSNRKHLVSFLPYWAYENYLEFINNSSNDKILASLVDKNVTKELSNEADILLAKKMFGINFNKKKVTTLYRINIYKYLYLVVPTDKPAETAYIIKVEDKWYTLLFDNVSRTYTIEDFKNFQTNQVPITIENDIILVGGKPINIKGVDIYVSLKEDMLVDTTTGTAEINEIIFDIRFISNIEGVI